MPGRLIPPDTHFPELLARVLAADALQDLGSTRVLVDELGDIVHAVVDDNVETLLDRVVLGDLVLGNRL